MDYCPRIQDMAPQAATSTRSRARKKPKTTRPSSNVVQLPRTKAGNQRQWVAAHDDTPLLDLFQPHPDSFSPYPEDRWWNILRSIFESTDITVDTLVPPSGISRANLYRIMAPSERRITAANLVILADTLGIETDMWQLPLNKFWTKIRATKPGYRYDWDAYNTLTVADDAPLLDRLQPNPGDYSDRPGDRWWNILRSTLDHTGITVDILSDRSGISRSNLYLASSQTGESRNISTAKLEALAGALGFDVAMWWLSLDEFWAEIRSTKPGYRYEWRSEPSSVEPFERIDWSAAKSTWIELANVA